MKLTILIGFSLVLILLLNNICFGSEQDTKENALTIAFKKEIMTPDTIRTLAHVGLIVVIFGTLIGTLQMYPPIILLSTLIFAYIAFCVIMAANFVPCGHSRDGEKLKISIA